MKLNILLLHGMDLERNWLAGVSDVELMFPRYDKNNNYLCHSVFYMLPKFIKDVPFDAIIMTSTFMDKFVGNYNVENHKWIEQFEFLKQTRARKVVFAQDDYWFCEARDFFYVNYNIDRVHLVCPSNSWHELVPKYIAQGGDLKQGFTTYVTPYIKKLSKFKKKWSERKFDVIYRATRHPLIPNIIGEIKGLIGDNFYQNLTENNKRKYRLDICNTKKIITGEKWYRFLSDSLSILGSSSGSSVRLKNSKIRTEIIDYKKRYPKINAVEFEQNFLSEDDKNKKYTAISPRNLEAATLGTVQILVKGDYSKMLLAGRDYIELKSDGKNANEVIELLKDHEYCSKIVNNCNDSLLRNVNLDGKKIIDDTVKYLSWNRTFSLNCNFKQVKEEYVKKTRLSNFKKNCLFSLRIICRKVRNFYLNWF